MVRAQANAPPSLFPFVLSCNCTLINSAGQVMKDARTPEDAPATACTAAPLALSCRAPKCTALSAALAITGKVTPAIKPPLRPLSATVRRAQ
eukprot:scaffold110_cov315-Pavlova_lutheri.AAC.25